MILSCKVRKNKFFGDSISIIDIQKGRLWNGIKEITGVVIEGDRVYFSEISLDLCYESYTRYKEANKLRKYLLTD